MPHNADRMSPPQAAYLGIDAGGTKTAWLALDDEGPVAEGTTTPIQVAALGAVRAARELATVIASAEQRVGLTFAAVVAGLAGAGRARVRADMARELIAAGVRQSVQLCGDVLVAAATALADEAGVALWAGTGSFAVARALDASLHRVGGRGWLLGDAGSAFDLARRAAAAVLAAEDGTGEATLLAPALTETLQLESPLDLGPCLQAAAPAAIAALYPVVGRVADAGDAVARGLQAAGAEDLARLAVAAGRRAALAPTSLRVVLGGGLLTHDARMRDLVAQALARTGTWTPPTLCARAPARGAAELARAHALSVPPLSRWMVADGSA